MSTIKKIGIAGAAALALGATSLAMTTPAAAQQCGGHPGFHRGMGPAAAVGGLAAGAVVAF